MRDEDDRRGLVADAAADPRCDESTVRRPPRLRLQPSSSTRTTASRSSCTQFVAARRAGEVLACSTIEQPLGARPAAVGHRLRRMGARRARARSGAARSSPSSIRRRGALLARNPYNTEFAERVAFLDLRRPAARRGPAIATEFLGRNGALGPAGRHCDAASAVRARRRRARSVRRAAASRRARARRARRGRRSCSARPPTRPTRATLVQRVPGADRAAALRATSRATGTTLGAVQVRTPDRSLDVLRQRLAALPDARLPDLGAQRRSTSPAARSASAISCRTSMALRHARPDARARAAPARGGAPVRRRRRAALVASAVRARACARTSPTTSCGCRTSSRRYVDGDRRHRRARRDRAVPRGPGAAARRGRRLLPSPTVAAETAAACTSTACARSTTACASARTACR